LPQVLAICLLSPLLFFFSDDHNFYRCYYKVFFQYSPLALFLAALHFYCLPWSLSGSAFFSLWVRLHSSILPKFVSACIHSLCLPSFGSARAPGRSLTPLFEPWSLSPRSVPPRRGPFLDATRRCTQPEFSITSSTRQRTVDPRLL